MDKSERAGPRRQDPATATRRYKALLRTELTPVERDSIRRRIAEGAAELRQLSVGQQRSA